MSQRQGANLIGVSNTWLGRFLLPASDLKYVKPSPEIIALIEDLTGREVSAKDWPDPAPAEAETRAGA
ncbi:MAG: hypothetical protein KF842_06905 [Caulobacter sp.]|nr:hypothetical protein [Caulobacter sp.]